MNAKWLLALVLAAGVLTVPVPAQAAKYTPIPRLQKAPPWWKVPLPCRPGRVSIRPRVWCSFYWGSSRRYSIIPR
jgi:hypothetical protein